MRFFLVLILTFIPTLGWAYENPPDLTELPIEALMDIEVTSVSKKQQKLSDAAAAIFVITQEDIRRSGATSLPEILRMAPGVEVAHLDSNKWAVTIRGFNSRFANKLLVLIDGRSVYSPLFSGVFWEKQDTLLEDIDHIEVIRGPGATLWGANAVNGVINIITKHAKDTQGVLISAGGGTEERGFGESRYGGKIGEETYYRAYLKYFNRDNALDTSGESAHDGWDGLRGGFRVDSQLSSQDSITAQGDIYRIESGQTINLASLSPPFTQTFKEEIKGTGGNFLGRWRHTFSTSSDLALQIYYDRTDNKESTSREGRNNLDIDFQHRFALVEWQEIVWGLGYRFTQDDIRNSFTFLFNPDHRTNHLFNTFLQDDLSLLKERLHLILGSKFEYNDYTGYELQPTARMLWTPNSQHSVWGAISRAVRTPARIDEDSRINALVFPPGTQINPTLLPVLVSLFGNRHFNSEKVITYELGYRVQMPSQVSFDIAVFYNNYKDIRFFEVGNPHIETSFGPPHLLIPIDLSNRLKTTTYGMEMAIDWRPLNWWRLQASYSYLKVKLPSLANDPTSFVEYGEGRNPNHQFGLRSWMDLRRDLELNLSFRFVDKLNFFFATILPQYKIESYVSMDAQVVWKPHRKFELAIVGQNLLGRKHGEYQREYLFLTLPTEVERGIYGKVIWRF